MTIKIKGGKVGKTLIWSNVALTNQDGLFEWTFDVVPPTAPIDVTLGLSDGVGDAYTDLACIVRFNPSSNIDVRNGTGYDAEATVAYEENTSYHIRANGSVIAHTYNVWVTPEGGSEVQIAASYAFRGEQATVAQLNNFCVYRGDLFVPVSNLSFNETIIEEGTDWWGDDGSTNAPIGTALYPTALDTYGTNRPPWQVAGVDYHVGVPDGASLTDWRTINITGVTVNAANHYARIDADDITLDLIDWSLGGGASVDVFGSNVTLSNSYWLYTTAISAAGHYNSIGGSATGNLTIINCTLDGPSANTTIGYSPSSTALLTVKYCLIANQGQHAVTCDRSCSLDMQFNVIYKAGQLAGAHVNYLQFGNGTFPSVTVCFNFTYQPINEITGGTGFQFNQSTGSIGSASVPVDFSYNTMIYSPSGTGSAQLPDVRYTGITCTLNAVVNYNYIDKKQGGAFFYNDPFQPPGSAGCLDTYTNNINMVNGGEVFPG
jgi:hypothetical protein